MTVTSDQTPTFAPGADASGDEAGPIRALGFGDYRLDIASGRLWRGARPVHVTPKAFALLRLLARRAGELVTKQEILEAVWPGTAVGEDALTRCIGELRRALCDDARAPRYLETVHRRGLRFVAAVDTDATDAGVGRAYALVGREGPLAIGRAAIAGALAGQGQTLVLAGEPGIGKTRLAEELSVEASRLGALVLWSRAHEGESRPSYGLWTQVLREYMARVGAADLRAHAGRELREIAEPLPELDLDPPERRRKLEPAEARYAVFDAVKRLLVRAADRRPCMVVLDDLHAADADSLLVFGFLAEELASSRVLLTATLRDVGAPPNPPLQEVLNPLARKGSGFAAIQLRGLRRPDVRRFLALHAGEGAAERLADSALDKTAGNPLYLQELVRLIGDGADPLAPSAWRMSTAETVRDVLARRLCGLSDRCRDALELAAVAGSDFSLDVLERASDLSPEDLAAGICEAEAQRLLEATAPGRARFAHGLLREIVYEGVGGGARARLHRRIGQVLEADTAGAASAPVRELAHHFGRAALGGDVEKAIVYSTRAAEGALAAVAFEEAAAHSDAALDLLEALEPLDSARLAEGELSCARAHWLCGRPARARELAWQALKRARTAGGSRLFARAAELICEVQPAYDQDPRILSVLEDALSRIDASDDATHARLLAARSVFSLWAADPVEHERIAAEAVRLARRAGDPDSLLEALRSLCLVLLHPSREREWSDTYEEMIRVAQARRSGVQECEARLHRLEHRIQLGFPEEIARELEELERLGQRLPIPAVVASVLRARAGLALARGDLVLARRLAEQALAAGDQSDADLARMVSHLQLGALRHMECRIDHVVPEIRGAAAANPKVSLYQAGVIFVLCESGALDEARRRLQALAADDFAALPLHVTHAAALANLALSCARVGDRECAARLYERLLPYRGRTLTVMAHYAAGCADRFLGLLATRLERFAEAELHFETALGVDRRAGARTWVAHGLVDYARSLRARGLPEDLARAQRLLEEARELAAALGIRLVEREATQLLGG